MVLFWMCRDGIRKSKAQMDLSLGGDAKNKRKRFYRYIAQKRKAKESFPLLMDEKGELVGTDMEKAEVLNNFFASVFTASLRFPTSLVSLKPQMRTGGAKSLPL